MVLRHPTANYLQIQRLNNPNLEILVYPENELQSLAYKNWQIVCNMNRSNIKQIVLGADTLSYSYH